ncbi:GumC family protein [Glycocaulis abyssi]|uniref:non-specific protein-tyrosine kinase n=1 Tax=Glycocaulis abyssi TaxID=1433403 RepID=A0ABV9N5S6_9PROT
MAFNQGQQQVHADQPGDDELIDLRQLWRIFRRRLPVFAAVAFAVFALTVIVTMQMTPQYTATASVIIDPRQSQVIDIDAVLTGLGSDSQALDTEVQLIQSRSLATSVVNSLDLASDPEFNVRLRQPSGLGAVASAVRGFFSALVPSQLAQGDADEEQRTLEAVTSAVLDRLSARRTGLTYVIAISFRSENPAKAARIANQFADLYLLSQLEAKFDATERANTWLNTRLEALREEVRTAEQAVEMYRAEHGLLDAGGSNLTEQQISDLNAQLAIQRAELSAAESSLRSVQAQLQRGASLDTIGEVLRSETIRALRAQQTETSRRRSDLSSRYGPRHPEFLAVEREAADLEEQISREIQRIVAGLETEVNVARQRVFSLQNTLSGFRDELVTNNRALVRLRELEREAEASRTLFESFLNRFRQTSEQDDLATADARIVARAPVPYEPSAPNWLLNLALGLILAGVAGAGVVALLEVFDNGLRTEADVERDLGVGHIASIPMLAPARFGRKKSGTDGQPYDYVRENPLSGIAESFRVIRSAILLSNIDTVHKVVAITSALPGEGKTTTTYSLGRISAMSGSKTLILDCDLRRRLLTKAAAPDAEKGLLEVLSGDCTLDDVLVEDAEQGLHILPVVESQFTPRDVFSSDSFRSLMSAVRERYDLVLIDTAPVLAVTDTRVIAAKADAVVMNVKWKTTPREAAVSALDTLRDVKANVLGVALAQVDMNAQARYGYEGSSYYYKNYRSYYSG